MQRLYARVERLLTRSERKGDHKTAAALLGQLDDIARRMHTPGKVRPEEVRLKIVFDDPADPTGQRRSVDALQNLSFCVSHYGWLPMLAMLLRMMGDDKNNLSERLLLHELVQILRDDHPNEVNCVEKS